MHEFCNKKKWPSRPSQTMHLEQNPAALCFAPATSAFGVDRGGSYI
jgi:hypothetical protein